MPERLYLDSNVFISFVREEIDPALNLRYVESGNFFAFCAKQKPVLIISEWFLEEVERIIFLNAKSVFEEFERIGAKTIFVGDPQKESVAKIMKEARVHKSDAIHVAVAIENKADFIVTWNLRDFEKTSRLIKPISPSEILDTQ